MTAGGDTAEPSTTITDVRRWDGPDPAATWDVVFDGDGIVAGGVVDPRAGRGIVGAPPSRARAIVRIVTRVTRSRRQRLPDGRTAGQFGAWLARAFGREDVLLAGHPEHYSIHAAGGRVNIVETLGEHVCSFFMRE